jgi:hypothetical protein
MDDPRIAQARQDHQRDGDSCTCWEPWPCGFTIAADLLAERDQEIAAAAEARSAHAERIAELELRERSVLASFAEAQQEIARLQALLKARVTHP